MADVVTSTLKAQLMEDKCLHDSLSQAIRIAKNSGIDEKRIKPILLEKQKYKKICATNNDKVMRAMPLSTNVMQLEDGWHAIRYINKDADLMLKIDIIKPDDAYLLKRDARHERELSREQLDTLLPSLIDEEALELYKQKLATRAAQLLYEYTGFEVIAVDMEEVDNPNEPQPEITMASAHAGKRWVQRIMGIKSDAEAEEYRRTHVREVNEAVLEGYADAELVWEEKADDITYWFDNDNVMYVKGKQNGVPNIITLYEENFGFSKEINRMITFQQLEVLSKAKSNLVDAEFVVEVNKSQVEADVQAINDQIAVLESQIALLVAKRAERLNVREQSTKELKLAKDTYTAEFNKLFRKWDN